MFEILNRIHQIESRFIVPPPSNPAPSDAELTLGGFILGFGFLVVLCFLICGFIWTIIWLLVDVRSYEDLVAGIQSVKNFFRRWRRIFVDIWQKGVMGRK